VATITDKEITLSEMRELARKPLTREQMRLVIEAMNAPAPEPSERHKEAVRRFKASRRLRLQKTTY